VKRNVKRKSGKWRLVGMCHSWQRASGEGHMANVIVNVMYCNCNYVFM
jgi:hypothetical protein